MKHLYDLDNSFIFNDITFITNGQECDMEKSVKVYRTQQYYWLKYIVIHFYKDIFEKVQSKTEMYNEYDNNNTHKKYVYLILDKTQEL